MTNWTTTDEGKIFMVENLHLLFQDVNTVNIDRFGSLRDWINEANDEGYWNQLVKCLLHPDTPIPERPETWGPLHRGVHDVLLVEGALPIVTQMMMTMMMKAIAMMAMTTADTIKRAITMNHEDENGTNLPRHRDALPLCTSNNRNLILPPLWNTIQNGHSMMRIYAYKSGTACFNHSRFLGLYTEHLRLKLRFIIDHLRANIIMTRTIQQSLA